MYLVQKKEVKIRLKDPKVEDDFTKNSFVCRAAMPCEFLYASQSSPIFCSSQSIALKYPT